jgi:hypothetical protein
MHDLPTEDDICKALSYLALTDTYYATSIGKVKALEYQIKTIKALVYLETKGTIAEREARSHSSEAYRAFVSNYEDAVIERETISAKRKRAELTIEVWRSINANRRQGAV